MPVLCPNQSKCDQFCVCRLAGLAGPLSFVWIEVRKDSRGVKSDGLDDRRGLPIIKQYLATKFSWN